MLRLKPLRSLKRSIPEGVKRPLKDSFGAALSAVCGVIHRRVDPKTAVLVTSTARSGSTWLMNALTSRPRTCPVFEPLRASQHPALRGMFRGYYPRLQADDACPRLERYLSEVFAGRLHSRWSSNHATTRQILGARSFVVKFVRANRIWGWMARLFPENKKIVLVRHPCAVVSSMIRSGGVWSGWSAEDVLPSLREVYGPEVDVALDPDCSQDELLAATWATDLLTVLAETRPEDTLLVTYEALLSRSTQTVERLFEFLGEPVPGQVWEKLREASWTANPGAAVLTAGDPMTAWMRHVDQDSVERILGVAARLGIRVYDDGPQPDEAALHEAHRSLSGIRIAPGLLQ